MSMFPLETAPPPEQLRRVVIAPEGSGREAELVEAVENVRREYEQSKTDSDSDDSKSED